MGTHQAGFGKDTVYRFTNSIHINWIKFTTWLSTQIIKESIAGLTDEKRVNVLIVDDTLFERSSSKKVELLSKVYDHTKKAYKLGFRLLTLGWSDGNTFIPVNGCLLSTENRKNRINEAVSLDKRSAGYTRRNLAQTKATTVVLELIKAAKKALIPASHVLFDTWFCSPSSLTAIKEMGYDVIAMAKKTPKMHYLYNGKMQPLTEIYKQNKKRRGKSRYLLSVEVALNKDEKSIPARIVYVRNKNKRKDYLALITTDMNISEDEIIRIYGKRWDIEVFFKVCKSYLKLSKECNSLSYDAKTAHTAVVFTRYMMLAVENRQTSDLRTLGEIFYCIADEMSDISLIQAFHLLMQVFFDAITDKLSLTSEQLDQLLEAFMAALPKELKGKLLQCV
ncbi:MAG: transposase [Clostridiales bacterium]|nr:transposase [Clostridiales bacterium]